MKSTCRKIFMIVASIVAAFLLFQSLFFHMQVISLNSPQEYRENATILPTELLEHSVLPYTRDVMPVSMNVYGIFYNAVMVPFTKVLGTSYAVFRGVNGVFQFVCLWLLYIVLRKKRISVGISLLAIVMWYAQTLQSDFDILGRPEGLGELLFLGSIVIPWMYQFNKKSLVISVVLSVAAFYTKQYFLLGGALVPLYVFFFVSKRKGITYLIELILLFSVLAVVVQTTMEFYFYNTILFHIKNARYLVSYLIFQTKTFTFNNIGLLVIIVIQPVLSMRKRLSLSRDYFLFMFVATTIVILGKLGGHDGNFLSYYTELIGPFLIIVAATYIEKYKNSILIWVCILANLGVLAYFSSAQDVVPTKVIETNWQEWTKILDSYHDIYNAPPFAKYLYDAGRPVYDAGHTEYFTKAISRFNISVLNDARDVYNIHLHELDSKIRNRQFDLIILFHNYVYYDFLYTGYLHYFIEQNYSLKEIKPLLMYHNKTLLFELWVKK